MVVMGPRFRGDDSWRQPPARSAPSGWPRNRIGWFNGIARPSGKPRASAGSPSVGDGAGDRARHRAAIAVAGIFLRQRIAAALGTACRPGGAERARRDLDRRDQIIDRGFARRPEVAGLPGALRPAVLRLYA